MRLPKLYRVVEIEFWSLRIEGGLLGVAFDVDVLVTRSAMRVRCADGWKWSLMPRKGEHYYVDDPICLDEIGMDESLVKVK